MPWRALKGQKANPYHVWLSEIMLQQTTVTAVIPYFLKFIHRWPSLSDLAGATQDEVNQMWAGLGYYRRARGLLACAVILVSEYEGKFPDDEKELQALPGIGPYTSAAIASIAFDKFANVVDGNVERVVSRLYAVGTPLPKAKKKLTLLAVQHVPQKRVGDYAQGLMDLGATVCTPRSPKCNECPWRNACKAHDKGKEEAYPKREKKKPKPVRYGTIFVLMDMNGRVLLEKRPEEGLLAGMMGFPTSDWQEKPYSWAQDQKKAPIKAKWSVLSSDVHHVFTHFSLELRVAMAVLPVKALEKLEGRSVRWQDCEQEALPSVMRKVLKMALKEREE